MSNLEDSIVSEYTIVYHGKNKNIRCINVNASSREDAINNFKKYILIATKLSMINDSDEELSEEMVERECNKIVTIIDCNKV